MCVNNVFDIYTKTAPNRSTQVIFCDMSTPKSDARQDRFEIYRPDKSKDSGFDLIRKKVGLGSGDEDSSKRISSFADIKSYVDKHSPKAEDKLQEGDIAIFRIPSDVEQRNGRILRRGNENKHVRIFRYVTDRTFDAYSFQILENKQKFISQAMTGQIKVKRVEDVQNAELSYAEAKALCAGNPDTTRGACEKRRFYVIYAIKHHRKMWRFFTFGVVAKYNFS